MTDTAPLTNAIFAFLLALAISIPAFLGDGQTMKPFFYALVLLPTIGLILARKIDLATLYKNYPYVFLLAAPLLYWSASNLWSAHPETFLPFLRRSLTTFIFIIGVAHITATLQQGIIRYLDLALLLVAIGAAIKLVSMLFADTDGSTWRMGNESVFGRGLHAAHYFGFFAIYGLVRFYQEAKSRMCWAYIASAAPCLLYVLMTYSRGPLISAFLVYLIISIFWFKKISHAIFATIIAAVATGAQLDSLLQRGISFRFEIWQGAMEIVRDNFWLGVGLGTPVEIAYGNDKFAPHAHSLYLDILARSGFFGLLLLVAIALFVLRKAFKPTPEEQLFVATLLFFFMSMMTDVQKLVNSPSGGYIVFWLPLTALLVVGARARRKKPV